MNAMRAIIAAFLVCLYLTSCAHAQTDDTTNGDRTFTDRFNNGEFAGHDYQQEQQDQQQKEDQQQQQQENDHPYGGSDR